MHRPSALLLVLLPALGCDRGSPRADPCESDRLVVQPVLYVPADGALDAPGAPSAERADTLLALARQQWLALVETDTFCAARTVVYRSERSTADYDGATAPDSAHLMTASLLEDLGEDRNDSRHVFVAILARPDDQPCGEVPCLGGGRTFNGFPGTGGGIVQLEGSSLQSDAPYPMLSTLVHELGHAFGLTHGDCHGEDMQTGTSIMSYNPAHWSDGTTPSETPGDLLPEQYFLLDGNDLALPGLTYDPAIHDPTGRPLVGVDGTCELPAMDGAIGSMDRQGYELFFDDALVSGPEAQFYTHGQARENCAWNVDNQPTGIAIDCRFDGEPIGGRAR